MKYKALVYIILGILLFASCDPNKEIYEEMDNREKPYSEMLEITLKDADYTAIKTYNLPAALNTTDSNNVKAIDTYKSFSTSRPADKYVPEFLKKSFIALDSASQIKINYSFDHSAIFAATEIFITPSEMNFTTSSEANTYIKANILNTIQAIEGSRCVVKYKLVGLEARIYYYYTANAWTTPTNSYVLTKDDFASFGSSYSNFSSTMLPSAYLPTFLKIKYPYAKQGDIKELIYDYYGTTTQTHVNKYFYKDGAWSSLEQKSDIFFNNGEAWFFDPTVRYTMVKADYQIIVDYIVNHPELNVYKDSVYTTGEWYWGAGSYYGNFDLRPSKHRGGYDKKGEFVDKTDDEVLAILLGRIDESILVMANGKFTDAQPFSNGIPVYYEITFDTYDPARHKYKVKLLCIEVGKFEIAGELVLVQ